MPFPLTPEQRNIVDDRGGELLVSAAAGSGKTRVLVERLLERVAADGLDVDNFLVITYTKAAAAELRTRTAQELSARMAQSPNDRHLRRQSTLIYKAQISTIHSFCSALLRESGHLLDLDPDFRLCDEGEGQVLRARVLEDLLDRQYEGIDPEGGFAALVDTLSAGRDDSRLRDIVLDIFGRIQSHADPDGWLNEQKTLWRGLDGLTGAEETVWGALLLDHAARQCRWCVEQLKRARELAVTDELLEQNYLPTLEQGLADVSALLAATGEGWDAARARLPVTFIRAGAKKKRTMPADPNAEETGARMKSIRDRCKKLMDALGDLLDGDSREALDDLRDMRPAVLALLDLVGSFGQAYADEKKRRGVLDFSDLEHFSLKLLTSPDGPTALAKRWSARFAEVMVDEYQDTNQVQNAIFNAISDGGRKLFQVGDVKQSIYRFRLADPTIFLEKYRRFPDGDAAADGQARRRVLSRNFRSRPEILEGCNDLFRDIMSTKFGELDYTDDQALVPGATFPETEDARLELALLDLSCLGEQGEDKEDKDLLEARWAARRIRELLSRPAREGERPLVPSDVMILLRSPGPVLHHYIRALSEQGLPWSADGGEDFFETTEVNVALSLLQIVDNPRQDVPLIAAMRSPVYGFTGDELALLRAGRAGDFYAAVTAAADGGNSKCAAFLSELDELRFGMGDKTCRQMVWQVYERTNLLGLFGAMEGGGERRDNLLSLYALAGALEGSGCRTLFQFLLRLDRLRAAGRKLTASAAIGEGDGVSIMSIHRSKGLEKRVVLVCGLGRQLNQEDQKKPVLFHPQYGVGPKGLDRERMVEYPTLARQAVGLQLRRELMAEELRLLYVAMTRAQEKLILTMGLTRGGKALEGLGDVLSVPPDPVALEAQNCVGNWVLLHALTRPESASLRAENSLPSVAERTLGPAWNLRWEDGAELLEAPSPRARLTAAPTAGGDAPDDLTQALAWSYPHAGAVDMPSKLTATQLTREGVLSRRPDEEENKRPAAPVQRPRFVSEEEGLTPAQRGTALHMAMQFLPLKGAHTLSSVREGVERLVAEGFLTPQQGQAVEPEKLLAFYESPLGRAAAAGESRQEFKFSVLLPAGEFAPEAAGEQVLLQGVIDCWFEDGGGVTVLDFKSDRVSAGMERARAEEYRPQLEAYARALSEILKRPVSRKALWFFATNTAVTLDD